jgi:dihydroorotase
LFEERLLMPPILITRARLVDPASGFDALGWLLIANGKIADFGAGEAPPLSPEARIIHGQGHILCPSLIDMRAFTGEPGAENRETLKTAGEAGAAGGVTTIVSMPDTSPCVDSPAIVDFLIRRARDKSVVNILPAAAMTKGLLGEEMTEIGLLQEAGAVMFTQGAKAITNAQVMRRIMTYAKDFDALIAHHVEDPDIAGEGVMNEGELSCRLGLAGIPVEAETIMLERDLRLARLTGTRYHAMMISCADSVNIIRRAKHDGVKVSCGVSINHLTLNEIDIGDYRTFLKLSPPLRGENERLALIEALNEGVIDVIVSDHNPQDVETKRLPFAEAENGALGLETLLPAAMRLVHGGHITLPRLLQSMTCNPASLLKLSSGRIVKGTPADLILFDPDDAYVLDKRDLRSRSKNSPFDEARLEGRVRITFVNGRIVHEVKP